MEQEERCMDNRLKELRTAKHMTQIALQIATGIDQAILSKYENGQRSFSIENLIILADYFHVGIDYLLCRTDDPKVHHLNE